MIALVGRDRRLGEALGLVIDRSRSNGIDIAPIGLHLRMHQRISIAFRRGGMQVSGAVLLRNLEGVEGSCRAHQQRFDSEAHVVDRARRGGEVEYIVDLADIEWLGNIPLLEDEARLVLQMCKVLKIAGGQIIHSDNLVPLCQQSIAQM